MTRYDLRFRHVSLCLLVLSCCGPASLRAAEGTQRALIIAVENYDPATGLEPAVGANQGAERLANVLRRVGYEAANITVMREGSADHLLPTRHNIWQQFDALLKRAGQQDTLLVVTTSHGTAFQAHSYLCPQDTTRLALQSAEAARASLIPVAALTEKLAKSQAANKLLVVDACRQETRLTPSTFAKGLQQVPEGVWLMSSCSQAQRSYISRQIEPGTPHAIFTYYFTEGLRGAADRVGNNDGTVSLCELNSYAHAKTLAAAQAIGEQQTPEIFGGAAPFRVATLPDVRPALRAVSSDPATERRIVADMLAEQALRELRAVDAQQAKDFQAALEHQRSLEERHYQRYHAQMCYVLGQYIAPALRLSPDCTAAHLARALALRMSGEYASALEHFRLADEQFTLYVKGSLQQLEAALAGSRADSQTPQAALDRVPLYAQASQASNKVLDVALHAKVTIDQVEAESASSAQTWLRIAAINDRPLESPAWIRGDQVHWVAEAADVYIPATPLGAHGRGFDVPAAFARMETSSNRFRNAAEALRGPADALDGVQQRLNEGPAMRILDFAGGIGGFSNPLRDVSGWIGTAESYARRPADVLDGIAGQIEGIAGYAGAWQGYAASYGMGIERATQVEASRERLIQAKNLDPLEEKPLPVRSPPWVASS